MKQVVTAFVAIACFALLASQGGQAQQPKAVTVQIINLTGSDISVHGYTVVNNVPRKGAVLQVKKKGGMAFEQTAGSTARFYAISDPVRPLLVLQTIPVNVPNRDVVLKIMPSPTNPKMLIMVAE